MEDILEIDKKKVFYDDYLFKRYRFSAGGVLYLCQHFEPHIKNVLLLSISSYLYAEGDAENLSKNGFADLFIRWSSQVLFTNIFTLFTYHLPIK